MNAAANSSVKALHAQAAAFLKAGRLADAAARYEEILHLAPRDTAALANLGTLRVQRGEAEEGARLLGLALETDPAQPMALNSLGGAFKALGRLEEALASYDRALALQPDLADACGNRGNVLRDLGRLDAALASYDSAVRLRPDAAGHLSRRGGLLKAMGRFDAALADYDRALAINPGHAESWFGRANVWIALNRPEQALADFGRAIAVRPDYAEAFNNRSNAFKALNRLDEALADCAAAIALKADYVEAHWNQALLHLLRGDHLAGWRLYEWRWRRKDRRRDRRHLVRPLWLGGEDIRGKTVLLHAEQGLGDCIQFCRYAKEVAARGARVVLETPPPLVGLMRSLGPEVEVVEYGGKLPPFDYHVPLMSLPHAFGTDMASIPAPAAYLHPPAAAAEAWSRRLGAKTRFRAGLVWAGNARHTNDRNRSIGLAQLRPLLEVDAEFHSLQKDMRAGDAPLLGALPQLGRWETALRDFSDTAALVAQMDLVISIDTSVTHLAAAMGKPTWIMLPFAPDFRWQLDREDSPWYPSVRLFRQPAAGDWRSVIERAASELARLCR